MGFNKQDNTRNSSTNKKCPLNRILLLVEDLDNEGLEILISKLQFEKFKRNPDKPDNTDTIQV